MTSTYVGSRLHSSSTAVAASVDPRWGPTSCAGTHVSLNTPYYPDPVVNQPLPLGASHPTARHGGNRTRPEPPHRRSVGETQAARARRAAAGAVGAGPGPAATPSTSTPPPQQMNNHCTQQTPRPTHTTIQMKKTSGTLSRTHSPPPGHDNPDHHPRWTHSVERDKLVNANKSY